MGQTTITDLEVTAVSIPIQTWIQGSSYDKQSRATVIVTVQTDSGVTGQTFSGDFGDVGEQKMETVVEFIEQKLRPKVLGEPLLSTEAMWEDMFGDSKKYMGFQAGERFLYVHAVGAVDTAIWDAVGKELDVPLYELWGGYQDSVPIISTGAYYAEDKTHADLVEEARSLEEERFCGMKIKIGGKTVEEDLARVAAIREGIGDEFILGCDAN